MIYSINAYKSYMYKFLLIIFDSIFKVSLSQELPRKLNNDEVEIRVVTFVTRIRRGNDFSPRNRTGLGFRDEFRQRESDESAPLSSPVTNGFATSSARSTPFDLISHPWWPREKLRTNIYESTRGGGRGGMRRETSHALD